ncbi:iron complex transport system substrate-binding protein [Fodinibius salinus]|uniref:Iron complex transport system substrate-binding protein n=1 Tax=Fodinibius salinus TaxID=860790 RepID=A0A5D3YPF1_9BACT|nr:cobalamin-binding protein [Fodinibius salinus]TYP94049.1 iron complex transport system substrate-binding protein [Fodinibius salinus]
MRIVSLLPSTTEIISALGKQNQLVGRSHECDFPNGISSLPACTESKFNADGNSYEIDQRIKALLQEGLSIYRVDENQLADLDPDIIVTQDHCEVCAASVDDVKQAVRNRLGKEVKIISVSPTNLFEVVDSIRTIADAIGARKEAEKLTAQMKSELKGIQEAVTNFYHPEVLALEWMDPLMAAGNWIPELIQLAGGYPVGAQSGQHSPSLGWQKVQKMDPPIITITPCGYSIEQTLSEISILTGRKGWDQLSAVKNKQVFVMDGNHFFNRPGPRLVDSTQILAEILHPAKFRNGNNHSGWINLYKHQFQQDIL